MFFAKNSKIPIYVLVVAISVFAIVVVLLAQPLLAHFKDKRERTKAMRNE